MGVNASDSNFNTVEKTGGAASVTLSVSQIPSHTHTLGNHSHTMGNHTHSFSGTTGGNSGSTSANNDSTGAAGIGATGSSGGGGSHSNLQPYITCYIWKRTA